jgi:hypothetical protein
MTAAVLIFHPGRIKMSKNSLGCSRMEILNKEATPKKEVESPKQQKKGNIQ